MTERQLNSSIFTLGLMKSGQLWRKMIGQGETRRNLLRPVYLDYSQFPFASGDKDAFFLQV